MAPMCIECQCSLLCFLCLIEHHGRRFQSTGRESAEIRFGFSTALNERRDNGVFLLQWPVVVVVVSGGLFAFVPHRKCRCTQFLVDDDDDGDGNGSDDDDDDDDGSCPPTTSLSATT